MPKNMGCMAQLLQENPNEPRKNKRIQNENVNQKRSSLTDKHNYKSLSLRNHTINELDKLSTSMFDSLKLSRAKTVEILIKDRLASDGTKKGRAINETNKEI